ncbi:MAG: AI-2E family transporter, partial [Burkholderiales bacterium]
MNASLRTDQILGLGILALLLVGCFLVLQPFLTDLLWAAVLAYSSWPLYVRLRARLRGVLAALLMTLAIVLVVLAPFAIAATAIVDNADRIVQLTHRLLDEGLPQPPAWVASLPVIGGGLDAYWRHPAEDAGSLSEALRRLTPLARSALVTGGQAMATGLLHLALSIFLAYFLFLYGEGAVAQLRAVMSRLAGLRAERLLSVAGGTVVSVVHGILGTALAQGLLAGIGFAVAGIPAAPLLGLLTFFLSIVPVGPPLVWIPAAIWLYLQGSTGWAIFVLAWGLVVVSGVDNIVKPMLISRGSHMPFVMVFLGVLGGAVAFGLIGVFLGPTLLALGYRMLLEWIQSRDERGFEPQRHRDTE